MAAAARPDLAHPRTLRNRSVLHRAGKCKIPRHPAAGECCGPRAAIGLQHVAFEPDLSLAEAFEVGDGAQGPPDQALDFLGAARLLAARGFALGTAVGRTRQHAVFRRHPAAAGVAQEGRSEEHTSELQSLMRISYAVFCLKKKKEKNKMTTTPRE